VCTGDEGSGGEAEGRGEAGRDAVVVLKSQRPSIFTENKKHSTMERTSEESKQACFSRLEEMRQ